MKLIDETILTSIADAIRAKNGSSDKYKPAVMPDAIKAISSGGTSSETVQPVISISRAIAVENVVLKGKSLEIKIDLSKNTADSPDIIINTQGTTTWAYCFSIWKDESYVAGNFRGANKQTGSYITLNGVSPSGVLTLKLASDGVYADGTKVTGTTSTDTTCENDFLTSLNNSSNTYIYVGGFNSYTQYIDSMRVI